MRIRSTREFMLIYDYRFVVVTETPDRKTGRQNKDNNLENLIRKKKVQEKKSGRLNRSDNSSKTCSRKVHVAPRRQRATSLHR